MPPVETELIGIDQEDPTGYRAVVRYDDIRRVSRDPKTFCSGQGVFAGDEPAEIREATLSFIAMDAPRHTKLRGLVSSAFTPRQIARIEAGSGPRPPRSSTRRRRRAAATSCRSWPSGSRCGRSPT